MATATDPICSTARLAQTMPIWMHMDTVCVTLDTTVTTVTCKTIHLVYTHVMVIVAEDVPALMHLTVTPVYLIPILIHTVCVPVTCITVETVARPITITNITPTQDPVILSVTDVLELIPQSALSACKMHLGTRQENVYVISTT